MRKMYFRSRSSKDKLMFKKVDNVVNLSLKIKYNNNVKTFIVKKFKNPRIFKKLLKEIFRNYHKENIKC